MKTLGSEFGVFEGNESVLIFSHNHAVLEQKKPFITGQLVAWSILHNSPRFHAMSEDVYYLMLQLPQHVNIPQAIKGLSDEETRANRQQFVQYNGTNSSYHNIKCGVPQGSILGPLLMICVMCQKL